MEKPMLKFNRATSQSGFTNASTSASNDKNASIIIREILQNSFDSAIVEAEQAKASVKFSLEYIKKDEIPGIDKYENTISSISNLDLSKNEQEQDILNVINDELKKDEIPVLFIRDNGIGFEPEKMVAVLSDGISNKSDPSNSGGSYGNGHYSAFNISNLRYVMYGGKLKDNSLICSGQALLRTHHDDEDYLRLGTGFYVTNDKPIEVESDNFPKNENIPALIKNKLDVIEEGKTGAIIAIIGFNFFGKKKDESNLMKVILASVARNFFVAVKDKQLSVEVEINGEVQTIDSDNFDQIFKETKNITAEPDYKIVEKFYKTFTEGEESTIETKEGNVKVHYQLSDSTSLALCRNGMWISASIPPPLRKNEFIENKFFNALILPQRSTSLSTLVRRAEGNLHNDIKLNRFTEDKDGKKKRKDLQAAFKEVRDFLLNTIGKNENNSFEVPIPDLTIEMISDKKNDVTSKDKKSKKKKSTKKIKKSEANTFGEEESNASGDRKKTDNNKKNDEKRRAGSPFSVKKFLSSHDGDSKIAHINFSTGRKATNLLICLRIDNGTDPSCDNSGVAPRLKIKSAKSGDTKFEIINEDTIEFGTISAEDVNDTIIEYETNVEGKYTIHYEFLNSLAVTKDKND